MHTRIRHFQRFNFAFIPGTIYAGPPEKDGRTALTTGHGTIYLVPTSYADQILGACMDARKIPQTGEVLLVDELPERF